MGVEWFFLTAAMLVPFLGALGYFVWLPASAAAQAAYGGVKLFTVAWPALWLRFGGDGPSSGRRRGIEDGNLSLCLGLAGGLGLAALMLLVYRFGLQESLRPFVPAIRAKAAGLGVLEHYLPFAVFVSAAHSLIEEYYWRWFVYGRLERLVPARAAVGLSALAFALHHYVILWQFFGPGWAAFFGTAVGAGGAYWAWLYRRTGSLWGPWVSHACVDAAIFLAGYHLLFG
ncbi:MAG: CPBP family intramembrane glutamic endopeptidase [Elusimicrobiota bacterium]